MLLEMDLETTIYVTGIAVVVLQQSIYFDFRMGQVHKKLDKITADLAELRQLELVRARRCTMGIPQMGDSATGGCAAQCAFA